jgi:predicted metal-dependent peptidase
MKLKLSEFFVSLILKKSFYGRLAAGLQRIAKPGLGTMAVGVRDGRATFFYDPAFIERIPFKSAMFALEHEMLHLMLDHIPRYLELLAICPTDLERKKAAAVYNIAMDAAINGLLRNHDGFEEIQQFCLDEIKLKYPDMPDEAINDPKNGMVLPEKFDLPLDGHFELYQWLLMQKVEIKEIAIRLVGATTHGLWVDGEGQGKKPEKGQGKGDGQGQGEGEGDQPQQGGGGGGTDKSAKDLIFDGSTFADMSPEELLSQAHRMREGTKQLLRDIVRSMGGIGRGTLPSGVEEWLEAFLAEPVVPWWEIFATRARMSRNSKYRRSPQTPNRALLAMSEEDPRIIASPGRIRDKSWRIFFYVDTSGSMSTESLEIAKNELKHMLDVDENMEIRYMQGDAATHMDVVLHTGDDIPGQMVGRGGTDFDAYFIHMGQYVHDDSKAPDLVVVYTDGYAPAVEDKNRLPPEIPVVWLVTPHHSSHALENYGEIIVCDPEHNDRYNKKAA